VANLAAETQVLREVIVAFSLLHATITNTDVFMCGVAEPFHA